MARRTISGKLRGENKNSKGVLAVDVLLYTLGFMKLFPYQSIKQFQI